MSMAPVYAVSLLCLCRHLPVVIRPQTALAQVVLGSLSCSGACTHQLSLVLLHAASATANTAWSYSAGVE